MTEEEEIEATEFVSERLQGASPIMCDFIVGDITDADTGDRYVTIIPEKEGDIGHIFFVMPVDLALQVGEAILRVVKNIAAAEKKQ